MTTDTTLIEKREELKRRLLAGEYKTLVDVFLAWFERLLRKIIRRTKPLPIWLVTAILCFVLTLIGFTAVYVAGDWPNLNRFGDLMGFGDRLVVLWVISNYVFYVASVVIMNQYIGRIFVFWGNNVIDATESIASLEMFEDWLVKSCNWRLHLLVIIIGGLLGGLYLVVVMSAPLSLFVGYGTTLTAIIISMFSFAFAYLLLLVVLLSARLRRYDLRLFASDPSSSELVSQLSSQLESFVYYVAVFAAILTLSTSWFGLLPLFGIFLLSSYWLPIVTLFLLNQTGLSSIIRRAKWRTLNEIQAKVEKLQATENFENKETMETINRLMEYHDRVKATRNSAIDLNTTLNLINSLLLPLLAFLIGNLDLVLKLFASQP